MFFPRNLSPAWLLKLDHKMAHSQKKVPQPSKLLLDKICHIKNSLYKVTKQQILLRWHTVVHRVQIFTYSFVTAKCSMALQFYSVEEKHTIHLSRKLIMAYGQASCISTSFVFNITWQVQKYISTLQIKKKSLLKYISQHLAWNVWFLTPVHYSLLSDWINIPLLNV